MKYQKNNLEEITSSMGQSQGHHPSMHTLVKYPILMKSNPILPSCLRQTSLLLVFFLFLFSHEAMSQWNYSNTVGIYTDNWVQVNGQGGATTPLHVLMPNPSRVSGILGFFQTEDQVPVGISLGVGLTSSYAMRLSPNGTLGFYERGDPWRQGTMRVTIKDGGNFGINVEDPLARLHVVGPNPDGNNGILSLFESANNGTVGIGFKRSGSDFVVLHNLQGGLSFFSDRTTTNPGKEIMTIDRHGGLTMMHVDGTDYEHSEIRLISRKDIGSYPDWGIGIENDAFAFNLSSGEEAFKVWENGTILIGRGPTNRGFGSNGSIRYENDRFEGKTSAGWVNFGGGSGSSVWSLNGTDAYYNNGNVGIGTTTPQEKLEVVDGTTKTQLGHQVRVQDMNGINFGVMQQDQIHIYNTTSSGLRQSFNKSDELVFLRDEGNENTAVVGLKQIGNNLGFIASTNSNDRTARMTLTTGGRLGIGTGTPESKLHVKGFVRVENVDASNAPIQIDISKSNNGHAGYLGTITNHHLNLGTNNYGNLLIERNNGQVILLPSDNQGIFNQISASLKSKYQLFVPKGILSEDYALAPVAQWADYVFEEDYQLTPLSEVEGYIKENNHLPDVPSAKEVAEDGYSLHDMNVKFLRKIEELTLYTIEQQKEIKGQHEEIKALKEEMEAMKKLMEQN